MEINRIEYYIRHMNGLMETLPSVKRKMAKEAIKCFKASIEAYNQSGDIYCQIQDGYVGQENLLRKVSTTHKEMAERGLNLYKQTFAR